MKQINSILLAATLLFSSCCFNKKFLRSYKFPTPDTEINLHDSETGEITVFTVHGENLQPVFIKQDNDTLQFDFDIEGVVFESSSGNKLNGWFLKPKDTKPEVTLLHLHGNGGYLLAHYSAMVPLVKEGFQIFTFDYSGFGFSTGEATRDNVLKDGLSAVDYITSREDVKDTKLVLYGQSLGGHLAAVVAEQKSDKLDAVLIEGAFSSHKDVAADRAGLAGRILTKEKYSAVRSIRNYHKPLLVIHSTEDKVIPLEMGQKIYAYANKPKSFYQIEKCHICGPRFYSEEIGKKKKAMLAE